MPNSNKAASATVAITPTTRIPSAIVKSTDATRESEPAVPSQTVTIPTSTVAANATIAVRNSWASRSRPAREYGSRTVRFRERDANDSASSTIQPTGPRKISRNAQPDRPPYC